MKYFQLLPQSSPSERLESVLLSCATCLGFQQLRQEVASGWVVGIDFKGGAEMLLGQLQASLLGIDDAEISVSFEVLRI